MLLVASYVLYAKLSGAFALLLALSTIVSFVIGNLMARVGKCNALLWLGVLFHIAVLGYFKYLNFFVSNLSHISPIPLDWATSHLILPVGISFYTFQAIGYLVDVHRGKYAPCANLLEFALFIAFFPKMVAGPIERADHLLPQFRKGGRATPQQLSEGLYLVVWGLVKKLVIAENAAVIADTGFNHPSGLNFYLVLAALAFTLQIYADFSGYSDIAKGVAAFLGIDLVWNFDMPYISRSPSEFWRRWHISLSDWFRDYVYIPLGGSRGGRFATLRNLLITMVLVGFWHGASWTYILWGFYCGLLLVAYRVAEQAVRPVPAKGMPGLLWNCSRWALFFGLTVFGWVIFRSDSIPTLWFFLRNVSLTMTDNTTYWYLLILCVPIATVEALQLFKKDRLAVARLSLPAQLTFYGLAFYALILFTPLTLKEFIYAQF